MFIVENTTREQWQAISQYQKYHYTFLFSFASLSQIENISIICIEETSNKQIMEEAACNGRVYLQKTEPGTHWIQVTSQGIQEKSHTLFKTTIQNRKEKNSLE